MATTSRLTYPQRRSGFTLIELLAVMLLILTVLGMGVPAMFAAERKSYVNQAMNELIRVHQACTAMQRELAVRGDNGIVTLTIQNPTTDPAVMVNVSSGFIDPAAWLSRTLPISISADQFISQIVSTNGLSWSYQKQTGFIAANSSGSSIISSAITLSFKALPSSGSNFKVSRDLTFYPQGYTEVP